MAGSEPLALDLGDGTQVILDGSRGRLRLNSDAAELARIVTAQQRLVERRQAEIAAAGERAVTTEGQRVEVVAAIETGRGDDVGDAAIEALAGSVLVRNGWREDRLQGVGGQHRIGQQFQFRRAGRGHPRPGPVGPRGNTRTQQARQQPDRGLPATFVAPMLVALLDQVLIEQGDIGGDAHDHERVDAALELQRQVDGQSAVAARSRVLVVSIDDLDALRQRAGPVPNSPDSDAWPAVVPDALETLHSLPGPPSAPC